MDYLEMLKAELIAECESKELSTRGTKAELIARLKANDKPVSEVREKRKVFNPMTHRFEFK